MKIKQPQPAFAPDFALAGFSMEEPLYRLAFKHGPRLYAGQKDKNDDRNNSGLWNHVKRVTRNIQKRYQDKVTPEELSALCAVAVLHDFPELTIKTPEGKKPARSFEQWTSELRGLGFPQEIIDDIDGTALREGEAYLDLYRRCGQRPRSRAVKLHGDLMDHAMRTDVVENPSQKFIDKVHYLYEMGRFYLMACDADESVCGKTVAEYIMTDPKVPRILKNSEVLARYSPPGTIIPAPVYGVNKAFEAC